MVLSKSSFVKYNSWCSVPRNFEISLACSASLYISSSKPIEKVLIFFIEFFCINATTQEES